MNTDSCSTTVVEFKKRMLVWSNPVEYVNNMYGSHPDDDKQDGDEQVDYFSKIYGKGAQA
jgi:hypothetical protein